MPTTTEVIAGLKKWVQSHDDHVAGAVHLLIEHDHWLRDAAFLKAAVVKTSVAIALGSDQFRLSQLGLANTRIVARAVDTALGLKHYEGRRL
jgi:hypothetical protein